MLSSPGARKLVLAWTPGGPSSPAPGPVSAPAGEDSSTFLPLKAEGLGPTPGPPRADLVDKALGPAAQSWAALSEL